MNYAIVIAIPIFLLYKENNKKINDGLLSKLSVVSSSKFRILLTLKRKNLITLFDSKIGLQSKTEKCGRTLTAEIFSKSDILIKILKNVNVGQKKVNLYKVCRSIENKALK